MATLTPESNLHRARAGTPFALPLRVPANGSRRHLFRKLMSVGEALLDALMVVTSCLLANSIYRSLELGKQIYYQPTRVLLPACLFAALVVFFLDRSGAYQMGTSLLRVRETERVMRASVQSAAIVFTFSYLINFLFSRWLLGIAVVLVPVTLLLEKHLVSGFLADLQARKDLGQRVIIYGAGMTGRRLFSALARSPKLGLDPIVLVDEDPSLVGSVVFEHAYQRKRSAPVIAGPLTARLIRELGADRIVIAVPSISREKFLNIVQEANTVNVEVSFVPLHENAAGLCVDYTDLDGMFVATYRVIGDDREHEFVKRCFDFFASLLLIVLLAPVFLIIALLIRRTSPGPGLFVQDRVGQKGRLFRLFKFRTMYVDAPPYAKSPTDNFDPRITPIGRYLRRTSLDEMPQLFNVLRGEMSLVGPRPEMPHIVVLYQPSQHQRLAVKPGITGLWQLSADRRFSIHENIEYDLYYIRHQNFFMDLAILLHTLLFAARGI